MVPEELSLKNQQKMSVNEEKKFVIKEVFENVMSMKPKEYIIGKIKELFGIQWKIKLVRSEPEGVSLYFRLECLKPECSENEWSINTDIVIKIGESEHCTFAETFSFTHEKMKTVGNSYVYWNDTNKYLTNGKLSVEFTVTINSAIGVDLHSKKRVFDDDVAKESSDVVLIVGDQKFYVSKLYLSFHSTYFKSLFSGSFAESEKSIIELKDIDQNHFQVFLELIHGASLVYDFTVSKILKLADFFDAKTAIERCEEFLLTHSEKSIKDKFEMANKYKLEDLKKKCISELKTSAEFRSIIPEDSSEIDSDTWKQLLMKSATLF
ncbi:hypothetical protein B9Z55_007927 [Caenorhabditis nigoni]|uniref:BTB domain-containing protein n=1 Tax=Caenorhabditis nigoni TaxID=1611254 RepID=A0A2G5VC02_9PELO|nr:hypothetical protein B9Z55_007927 [Caenorhabditis nigoni]